MRNLPREHFKRGIVFNSIFHCGSVMFVVIVILQAWPNECISQSKPSQSSTYFHGILFCKQQRCWNFGLIIRNFSSYVENFRISNRRGNFLFIEWNITIHNDVLFDFWKISEDSLKVVRRPDERRTFQTFHKNFRRLPKIADHCPVLPTKIRRCFHHTPTDCVVKCS